MHSPWHASCSLALWVGTSLLVIVPASHFEDAADAGVPSLALRSQCDETREEDGFLYEAVTLGCGCFPKEDCIFLRRQLTIAFFVLFLLWHRGLNSWSCTYRASALPLSHVPCLCSFSSLLSSSASSMLDFP